MKKLYLVCFLFCIFCCSSANAYTPTTTQAEALAPYLYYHPELDQTAIITPNLLEILDLPAGPYNSWVSGNNFANGFVFKGVTDWRLPTVAELLEIYETGVFQQFSIAHWTHRYYWSNELINQDFVKVVITEGANAGKTENAYTDGGPRISFITDGYVEGAITIPFEAPEEPICMTPSEIETMLTDATDGLLSPEEVQEIVVTATTGLYTEVEMQQAIESAVEAKDERIEELTTALDAGLFSLEADFQAVFKNPDFNLPGSTNLEKLENLIQAINDLNKGRKRGIYKKLK